MLSVVGDFHFVPLLTRFIYLEEMKYKYYRRSNPLAERQKYVYSQGEPMYDNITPMFGNNTPLFTKQTYIKESRNVYRSKFLTVTGQGSAGGFLLNGIVFDIVEV